METNNATIERIVKAIEDQFSQHVGVIRGLLSFKEIVPAIGMIVKGTECS